MNKKELSILIRATRVEIGKISASLSNRVGDGDESFIEPLREALDTLENYITKYHELDKK